VTAGAPPAVALHPGFDTSWSRQPYYVLRETLG
jgi:hypothetical protein